MAGLSLGANPIEKLLHELGLWGLRFLLITLAVTPLRRWTGWNWLVRFRRMLGLFAFFYILLHFVVYAVLDQGLDTFGASHLGPDGILHIAGGDQFAMRLLGPVLGFDEQVIDGAQASRQSL